MSDYVEADGTPKSIAIRGKDLQAYFLWDQIVSGSVSLSTQQITQMTLAFREATDRWPTLGGGFLQVSGGYGPDVSSASCDIGKLSLQIGSIGVAPLGASAKITLEARSLGGQRLKVNTDPSTLSNVSYSQWVRAKVESLGMKYQGEGSPPVAQVGNSNGQDSWTTIQKLAGDLGFWAFEAAGTFYFARPSWLLEATAKMWVANWREQDDPNNPLLELPTLLRDGDSGKTTVTVRYRPGYDGMKPGDGLILSGIPGFEATYIITGVDLDFGPQGVVTVKAETPVDPTPKGLPKTQSPALANASAATTTGVRDPGAGSYGGTRLNAEQTANVKRILQVCQDRGLNPRAGLLSLMCAMQESTLRNLAGGDRDSVGLFQQRPSQGWGTVAQCRNPEYATGKFLDVLVKKSNWRTGTPTQVIQSVQRSAFPNAYAKWQPMAQALVNASLVTTVSPANNVVTATPGGGKASVSVRPLTGSQTYQQLTDIGTFGPSHRVTSTVRSRGGKSYHETGRAVDFAGPKPAKDSPELLALYRFWMQYAPYMAEIIYYGPGGGGIKDGKPFTYSASVQRDHHDHVHTAITAEGLRRMVAAGVIRFR